MMMKDWRTTKTTDGLRHHYSNLHPLIFQRTIERASSAGEAFDILESIPRKFPIVWDDPSRKWIVANDMWLDPGK